jgi:hypothetical protein
MWSVKLAHLDGLVSTELNGDSFFSALDTGHLARDDRASVELRDGVCHGGVSLERQGNRT